MPRKDTPENREIIREYNKKWYAKNAEKRKKQVSDNRSRLRKWLREYKSHLKCEICGENHSACLDFHHIDPSEKEINIPYAVSCGWSINKILKEIEKCRVLCANCHRKLHYDNSDPE